MLCFSHAPASMTVIPDDGHLSSTHAPAGATRTAIGGAVAPQRLTTRPQCDRPVSTHQRNPAVSTHAPAVRDISLRQASGDRARFQPAPRTRLGINLSMPRRSDHEQPTRPRIGATPENPASTATPVFNPRAPRRTRHQPDGAGWSNSPSFNHAPAATWINRNASAAFRCFNHARHPNATA